MWTAVIDIETNMAQTAHMLRTIAVLLLVASGAVFAQQPDAKTKDRTAPAAALSPENQKLADRIKASYYHPDTLPGLACTVQVDWKTFLQQLGTPTTDEILKKFDGFHIKVKALRGEKAQVSFVWDGNNVPATAEQLQEGMKQILQGFYQQYWAMLASSESIDVTGDSKVTVQADGGATVDTKQAGMEVLMTVDKDGVPGHFKVDSPATKGEMEPHYAGSPQPAPGDLRRIVGLDVTQEIGTTSMQVKEIMDYQPLDKYFIPDHLRVTVGGAMSIPMEFTDCTIAEAKK